MNPYSKHTSRLEVVTGKLLQYPKMRREAFFSKGIFNAIFFFNTVNKYYIYLQ